MSTELSVIKAENFVALSGAASGLREAQAASGETVGLGGLTWVRTPSGGGTTWEIEDGLGNSEPAREITGVLVLYRKRSILWPTEGDPQEGAKPLLVSDDHPDLAVARKVGSDYGDLDPDLIECCRREDGLYDVRPKSKGGIFHYAEFGTSTKGPGPRMKEQRIVGVLREGDLWPLMLTVQPGSLRNVINTIARLTVPYWQCIVRFTLAKAVASNGSPYSQLALSVSKATLTAEQGLAIKQAYTLPLTEALLSGRVGDSAE